MRTIAKDRSYEFCPNTDKNTFLHKLDKVLEKHGGDTTNADIYCLGNKQHASVEFIRCVPLHLIKQEPTWNPTRLAHIREWGDEWTLQSVIAEEQNLRKLPNLSRSQSLNNPEDKELYEITDGIHRTARARELKLPCLLAKVTETYIDEE